MSFWRFAKMQGGKPARLYVDGEIYSETPWWMEDGTLCAPDSFRRELDAIGEGALDVYVNSPGGDAAAGVAIATLLRQRRSKTRCIITGLAASAASLIPCGCDEVQMSPGALVMIHNPSAGAWGDHREMERAKNYLDKLKDAVICFYAERMGKDHDAIAKLMDDETFWTAEDALAEGFADEILPKPEKAEARITHGLRAVMALNQQATGKALSLAVKQADQTAEAQERAEIEAWLKSL